MSRARVDQIVNQAGTGLVEFPYGLEINTDQPLKIGGPVTLYGNSPSTGPNQIPKTGNNGELVWGTLPSFQVSAVDSGSNFGIRIADPSGQFTATEVEFVGGSNVTLTRAGDQITISSSYVNTNTITTVETSAGSPVSGTLILAGAGSTTVTQHTNTFSISSVDTTYTAGTGINLVGTEFSLPQALNTTDSPTFDSLTVTNGLTVGSIACSGNVTGTWNGGTIPIDKGGTGATTASSAFLALAPNVAAASAKFLTTDGSSIYWDNLPSTSGFTPVTYQMTALDGAVANSNKIRITDNGGNYSEVVLATSDDITLSRSGNTITIGSTNANDTTLTAEEVEDIVGGMIDNNANSGITVSYNDANGTMEYTVNQQAITDSDTTYDLTSAQITGGVGVQLIPGGTGQGSATDQVNIIGGNNVSVQRDSGTGNITIASIDTNTDTITRLAIAGPNTQGGAYASGDISFQASGSISMVQAGQVIAISASDTNSYVNDASYNQLTGALTLERTDQLSDIVLPITDLQTYLDARYVTIAGATDAKITSATFNTSNGNLVLTPNDGSAAIVANLDGRYVTDTGPNWYIKSGSFLVAGNNPGGFHVNRRVLNLVRDDGTTDTNVVIETEELYDYLDTLYAPITTVDTAVSSFTFSAGTLGLTVSNGDSYSYDLDARYITENTYVANANFDVTNGVLSIVQGVTSPFGTPNLPAAVTVDLDGRYKLDSALDVAVSALHFNKANGQIYAEKNDGTNTTTESLDGRYFNDVSLTGTTFTFTRTGGTNKVIQLSPQRIDVPNGARLLFVNSSAPCGYTKITSTAYNNSALRVVNGSGSGTGGTRNFTNVFQSVVSDGATVTKGNLDVGGNVSAAFGSNFVINKGNLSLQGNPTGNFSSGFSININGNPSKGNLNVQGHTVSWNQMPVHAHNYDRANFGGRADSDDGTVSRGANNAATGNSGGGGGHNHGLGGNILRGSLSGGYNGGISVGKGSLGIGGKPQYQGGVVTGGSTELNVSGAPTLTAGSINLAVKYVDVIICERRISAPGQCNINAGD